MNIKFKKANPNEVSAAQAVPEALLHGVYHGDIDKHGFDTSWLYHALQGAHTRGAISSVLYIMSTKYAQEHGVASISACPVYRSTSVRGAWNVNVKALEKYLLARHTNGLDARGRYGEGSAPTKPKQKKLKLEQKAKEAPNNMPMEEAADLFTQARGLGEELVNTTTESLDEYDTASTFTERAIASAMDNVSSAYGELDTMQDWLNEASEYVERMGDAVTKLETAIIEFDGKFQKAMEWLEKSAQVEMDGMGELIESFDAIIAALKKFNN